jgi:hypothetical protein
MFSTTSSITKAMRTNKRRSKMNKKFYSICIALLVAVMITACGGPAATPTAAPTAVPPTAVPPTTVPPTAVAPTAEPTVAAPTDVPPTAVPEYVTVKDDSGALQVTIPGTWTEIDGSPLTGDYPSAYISAAPSLAKFKDFTGPGAVMIASATLAKMGGYIQVLDAWRQTYADPKNCKYDNRYDYDDPKYEGKFDGFTACNGLQNEALLILVVRPKDNKTDHLVSLIINFPEANDKALELATAILDSFDVIGELPK